MPEFDRSQQLHAVTTTADIAHGLQAATADPLWFLAMQWLTGEFEAENGGRPVSVTVDATEHRLQSVSIGSESKPVDVSQPLEFAVEAEVDTQPPNAWSSAALEYSFAATTTAHTLEASEYHGDQLDWYHFDLAKVTNVQPDSTSSTTMIPTTITLPGAPNSRWWQFEQSIGSLVSFIDPEPNAMSMLLPEFLLVDINNWFMIPLPQRAGSMRQITKLEVLDSFGHRTTVGPAFTSWKKGEWGVFVLDGVDAATTKADGSFHFVPNIALEILHNTDLEEVRFIRDEDANLVWAHERLYIDDDGNRVTNGDLGEESTVSSPEHGLRYVLAAEVAESWIPYVPRERNLRATGSELYLRRARTRESATVDEPQYNSRVVGESWRIDEHEIPRSGVRVRRIDRFARGSDGREYFWVGRVKEAGERSASPERRYDYLSED